ncbi:NUDIX domain-containing protein [Streptococcus infantarius]|uniref:NUDIX domain-containing protein n=1 Tax=Streptococcus infantarius TaxID=102684 RepID=UPI00208FB1D1|nr:putative Nudix hydrolase [Streptococcus infantarius subsp. infantarius]
MNVIDIQVLVRGEKIPKGVYHLVSEVIVRHQDGTYLLTQRNPRKNLGGMWEATAAVSALQGKNPLECVKRELREETVILTDDFIEVGRVLHQKHQTYYVNYLCHTDVDKDSIVITLTKMVKW